MGFGDGAAGGEAGCECGAAVLGMQPVSGVPGDAIDSLPSSIAPLRYSRRPN